ncbi:MAG TPA: hypothetical protein PLL32_07975, partial [Anaeromyxobacteraceae bacterium]|nr:hypothetical protein [Anaeromyxobacteraceae bacterium]
VRRAGNWLWSSASKKPPAACTDPSPRPTPRPAPWPTLTNPRQAARTGTSPGRRRALLLLVVLVAGIAVTAGLALVRTMGAR